MKTSVWRALVNADSRSLWRDPLLGWMLLFPAGVALLLRLLIPMLDTVLFERLAFTFGPYHPLVMGGYLMTAPGLIGMVVGFLLLDERDAGTLQALRVTPLSTHHYLAYRTLGPLAVGTASTLVGYPLTGITPLPFGTLLLIVCVASLSAPILAFVLGAAAPNKVAGFAVVKALNAINLLPVVAFFVPLPLQLTAGILPPYWPMRALWSASSGEPYVGYLLGGVVVGGFAVAMSAALFRRRLLQRAR